MGDGPSEYLLQEIEAASTPGSELRRQLDDFFGMLLAAAHGRPSRLVDYLRSDQALGPIHRELLAMFAAGEFNLPKCRGRQPNYTHMFVADRAMLLFKAAKEDRRAAGLSCHGKSAELKDDCLQYLLEEIPAARDVFGDLSAEDREKIRDLMDRPPARYRPKSQR